jgi:hypothetical protein
MNCNRRLPVRLIDSDPAGLCGFTTPPVLSLVSRFPFIDASFPQGLGFF